MDLEDMEIDMDEILVAELPVEAERQWWEESLSWPGYSRWQVLMWYSKRRRYLDFCYFSLYED